MKNILLFFMLAGCSSASAIIPVFVRPDTTLPQASPSTCNNVTNPGLICCDQTICPGTQPLKITGNQPTGGSGAVSYHWHRLQSDGVTAPLWDVIPNADGADYQPDTLFETQYYLREARREGCEEWKSANIVTIQVVDPHNGSCAILSTQNPSVATLPLLSITPNPFSAQSTLHNVTAEALTITVFRSSGQFLRRLQLPAGGTLQFDSNDLPTGFYFLQAASSDGRQWTTKLIKTQ